MPARAEKLHLAGGCASNSQSKRIVVDEGNVGNVGIKVRDEVVNPRDGCAAKTKAFARRLALADRWNVCSVSVQRARAGRSIIS